MAKGERRPLAGGCGRLVGEADFDVSHLTELTCTAIANPPSLVFEGGVFGGAEQTHVPALLENYAFALHADVELIAFMNPEYPANLRRQDDSTQLVDLANYTR
jgi:hypothetical protein